MCAPTQIIPAQTGHCLPAILLCFYPTAIQWETLPTSYIVLKYTAYQLYCYTLCLTAIQRYTLPSSYIVLYLTSYTAMICLPAILCYALARLCRLHCYTSPYVCMYQLKYAIFWLLFKLHCFEIYITLPARDQREFLILGILVLPREIIFYFSFSSRNTGFGVETKKCWTRSLAFLYSKTMVRHWFVNIGCETLVVKHWL